MTKTSAIFLVSLFMCVFFFAGCASLSNDLLDEDFQDRHTKYQSNVRSGYAAINKKDYVKAIDSYSRAIAVSPFDTSHYYYRGLAWYKIGNKEKAIKDFDKVIILDTRWHSAFVYRGLSHMERGEYKKALSDYTRAIKLKPYDASIHNNMAWLYATANDEEIQDKVKALEHAKKAAELSKGKNAEILDTLAKTYFINGEVKQAIETEKKALKLMPDNERFKKNLKYYEHDKVK